MVLLLLIFVGHQSRDIGSVHTAKEESRRAGERCGSVKDPVGIH